MKITRVGVDIGKNMFHLCAVNQAGKIVWRKALKRHQWIDYLIRETGNDVQIGMEACGSVLSLKNRTIYRPQCHRDVCQNHQSDIVRRH